MKSLRRLRALGVRRDQVSANGKNARSMNYVELTDGGGETKVKGVQGQNDGKKSTSRLRLM